LGEGKREVGELRELRKFYCKTVSIEMS